MTPAAHKHLSKYDPVLRRLIREHGKCDLVPEKRRSPFQSLVQAVAHQQLNGTAANNILTRFKKLFPGRKFPRPEDLVKVTDKQIRACGFSFAKIKSIRDITEKTLSGVVPSSRHIVKLSDDEIIARLTEVRGVGRWTAGNAVDFPAWPARCFAGGRFRRAHGFSPRLQKTRDAEAEGIACLRRKMEAAPHDSRVVSLVRGGRGEEKEVTPGRVLAIKFPLGENSQKLLVYETFVVIGKIAGRGH